MPEVVIHEATDQRPPVPTTTPSMFVCRYWKWRKKTTDSPAQWKLNATMFSRETREDAEREAAQLIAEGCRNVVVVEIKGD